MPSVAIPVENNLLEKVKKVKKKKKDKTKSKKVAEVVLNEINGASAVHEEQNGKETNGSVELSKKEINGASAVHEEQNGKETNGSVELPKKEINGASAVHEEQNGSVELPKKEKNGDPAVHKEQNDSIKLPQKDESNGSQKSESTAGTPFESLTSSVSKLTMKAITELGFTHMTKIQSLSIPKLLEGCDLRGTAKTGSGKTLAFLIPAIELLVKHDFKYHNGTGVIVISPTRELAMQIYGVLHKIMKYHTLSIGLVTGGTNWRPEAYRLSKGVNILVSTPGRLLDHLQHSDFKFSELCCLIIDEADRIFDVGFEQAMTAILEILPSERQTMLFSATHDGRTTKLTKLALKLDPMEIDVAKDQLEATAAGLQQAYLLCPTEKRFIYLYTFIKKLMSGPEKIKMMIFFNSCKSVQFYHDLLNHIDIRVSCIHGKLNQSKRSTTFNHFSTSKSGILLCTDVAARGWDIPAVDWIIQYDPPDDPKEYIHRVGRTARAGGKGQALLFLREQELGFITYLKTYKVHVGPMAEDMDELADIQSEFENLISTNEFLYHSAMGAFLSYLRAYSTYKQGNVFNARMIDMNKASRCYGFQESPYDEKIERLIPTIGQQKRRDYGCGGEPTKTVFKD